MNIHYLMFIDGEGDVVVMRPAKGTNPEEDSRDENGLLIKYYYYPIDNRGEWLSTHYWDYDAGVFISRDPCPNKYARWVGKEWVWDASSLLEDVRVERTNLLWLSDWTQHADSPLTDSKKAEWAAYRTELRDFPSTVGNISSLEDVTWPTKPS